MHQPMFLQYRFRERMFYNFGPPTICHYMGKIYNGKQLAAKPDLLNVVAVPLLHKLQSLCFALRCT